MEETAPDSQVEKKTGPSKTSIIVRTMIAVALIATIVIWSALNMGDSPIFAAICVSLGLLVYLTIAYFLVPKAKRRRPSMFNSYARKRRANLGFIKVVLWPGRFIAIALLDFIAMQFGKTIDHNATKVDLTE